MTGPIGATAPQDVRLRTASICGHTTRHSDSRSPIMLQLAGAFSHSQQLPISNKTLSQIRLPRIRSCVTEMIKSETVGGAASFEHDRGLVKKPEEANARASLVHHWPEYLMEAGELGLFMFFACAFETVLQHPASPAAHLIPGDVPRRMLMGVAMGATAIAIVMSPWGKQSGGHFNPAVTLTFYRLGKVKPWDAMFYVLGQFIGAVAGVALAAAVLRGALAHGAVRYAVTVPGTYGRAVAFTAEVTISFILMATVLWVSNREKLARYTPYFAGALVAIFISLEAPLSGMSMNPARTFGSAFRAMNWHALWIYFTAPPLGMLMSAEMFLHIRGVGPICAKLHHANHKRCIFRCGYAPAAPKREPIKEYSL
jgi:aquaporin Z